MSTHIEEHSAPNTTVSFLRPHAEYGDGKLPPNQYALIFSSDEMSAIVGTAGQLGEILSDVHLVVNSIMEEAARPLTALDFKSDEDGCYPCPRCPEIFEPNLYDTLHNLSSAIGAHIESHRPENHRE